MKKVFLLAVALLAFCAAKAQPAVVGCGTISILRSKSTTRRGRLHLGCQSRLQCHQHY